MISAETQKNLTFLQREYQKLNARMEAYERRAFDETFESLNPIGAQAAAEGIRDEIDASVVAELRALDTQLDELNERLNELEGVIGEESRLLGQKREQLARDYNEKRKSVNRNNVSKGFWSIYGGLFFCIIFALIAKDAGLGLIGSVVGGVAGYAAGSYVMRYLSQRFTKKKVTDPEADARAKAELDAIEAEHNATRDEMHALQDRLAEVGKLNDPISELQDLIQDAIDEFDE